jgi:magnesium transporter
VITVYVPNGHCIARTELGPGAALPTEAVWIDLVQPTREEETLVEAALGIDAPTREEMQEIEVSSRLYTENGAVYMTATVMSRMDTDQPLASPVSFVLAGERLVTIRYAEPRPFTSFGLRAQRATSGYTSGPIVLLGLFESIVDRMADVLETTSQKIDTLSTDVFAADGANATRDFKGVLARLGRNGELTSKIRESLVSLARVVHFMQEAVDIAHLPHAKDVKAGVAALDKDIASLLDHVSFLNNKISFLLDATLGLINIEQNGIIKLFSVVSVALMPPTLIASIYGMNFKFMPELGWEFGYPMAIAMMIVSAILPFVYFKRKGWL